MGKGVRGLPKTVQEMVDLMQAGIVVGEKMCRAIVCVSGREAIQMSVYKPEFDGPVHGGDE